MDWGTGAAQAPPYSAGIQETIRMPRLTPAFLLAAGLAASHAAAQTVAFINPGKSDEIYWVTAARGMQAAAEDLGMKLEVRFTERDHTRTVEIARELAARPPASPSRMRPPRRSPSSIPASPTRSTG